VTTTPTYRLGVLNGDGIGPEIVPAAVKILDAAVAASGGAPIEWRKLPLGRSAIDTHGIAVPESTLQGLAEVDAWVTGPDAPPPSASEAKSSGPARPASPT